MFILKNLIPTFWYQGKEVIKRSFINILSVYLKNVKNIRVLVSKSGGYEADPVAFHYPV